MHKRTESINWVAIYMSEYGPVELDAIASDQLGALYPIKKPKPFLYSWMEKLLINNGIDKQHSENAERQILALIKKQNDLFGEIPKRITYKDGRMLVA